MTSARATVAAQALEVADGWSAPGSPASWALTAQLFRAIGTEDVLLDLAEPIPQDRLPPLLLSAAVGFLVAQDRPMPLAGYFPVARGSQPGLDDGFRTSLVSFARERADDLADLCRRHRYQMNEVRRSVDVLAALDGVPAPIALVDLGTGAGLGLQLDRYRYQVGERRVGDPEANVDLACEVRGDRTPALPEQVPAIASRVGVDIEPLDLGDRETCDWLAACIPPEIGAVNRFAAACEVVRGHPAPLVRADVTDIAGVLAAASGAVPDDAHLVLVDTFVHVFFTTDQLAGFRAALPTLGRDLDWVSVDPLVPLGPDARESVQGLPVPRRAVQASRAGVTGVIGRLSVRDGQVSGLGARAGASERRVAGVAPLTDQARAPVSGGGASRCAGPCSARR